MRVLYLCWQRLETCPPCMNHLDILRGDLTEVTLVCRSGDRSYVAGRYSDVIDCRFFDEGLHEDTLPARELSVAWMREVRDYRALVREALLEEYDFVWFGTEDSALFARDLVSIPYVLTCLEFWDESLKKTRFIRAAARNAALCIACERTRAWLMKLGWELSSLPVVIPNKFESHPRTPEMKGSSEESRRAIAKIAEKKIVLYQGWLQPDRGLEEVAEALSLLDEDLWLAVLSPATSECRDAMEGLASRYMRTVYLGYVPSPMHLEVTSHALIGIARYEPTGINNAFCAPNKIYEYAGFGIPMLCNDVPGLEETVGRFGAGLCIDFSRTRDIADALHELSHHREEYGARAKELFNATDTVDLVRSVVRKMNADRTGEKKTH